MALGKQILFAVFVSLPFATNAETTCYQCIGVADPSLCTNVTQCPVGSQCLIHKATNGSGGITYNMDCATNQLCTSISGSHNILGKRQVTNTECNACCSSSRCNTRCCNGKVTLHACCKEAGYTYVPETDICIKLYHMPQEWPAAVETCSGDNAHLIIVRNDTDFNAIKKHIGHQLSNIPPIGTCHTHDRIWIGANDIKTEGHFQWWDGKHLTAWQRHQLHGNDDSCDHINHGADCVLMNVQLAGHWNDRHCDYKLPFVCQMF